LLCRLSPRKRCITAAALVDLQRSTLDLCSLDSRKQRSNPSRQLLVATVGHRIRSNRATVDCPIGNAASQQAALVDLQRSALDLCTLDSCKPCIKHNSPQNIREDPRNRTVCHPPGGSSHRQSSSLPRRCLCTLWIAAVSPALGTRSAWLHRWRSNCTRPGTAASGNSPPCCTSPSRCRSSGRSH